MTVINRIRHGPSTVLDQVESRNRVWNPTTLDWEVETVDDTSIHDELILIRRVLEEILVLMKEK